MPNSWVHSAESSALTHVGLHRIGSFCMISLVFSEPLIWKREFFKVFCTSYSFKSQSVFHLIKLPFGGVFEMKSCKSAPLAFQCLSFIPQVTSQALLNRFSWNFLFGKFAEVCQDITVLVKIMQYWQTLFMKTYMCFYVNTGKCE